VQRIVGVALVAVLVAGCTDGGEPVARQTVLVVEVGGLPGEANADVTVTGPGGLNRKVTKTERFSDAAPGQYSLAMGAVEVSDGTRHPLAAQQTVDVRAGETTTALADYPTLIPKTTRILEAAGLNLIAATPGELTFAADSKGVRDIRPGEIIAAGVGPKTPRGLLRKVSAVREVNGRIVVDSVPARLEDAIPEGEYAVDTELAAPDQPITNRLRGAGKAGPEVVTQLRLKGKACGASGANLDSISKVDLSLKPRLVHSLKWRKIVGVPVGIKKASLGLAFPYQLHADYNVTAAITCQLELDGFPKPPIRLAPITIPIGPFPLVLVPKLSFVGKAAMDFKNATAFTVNEKHELKVGAEWRDGGLRPIKGHEDKSGNRQLSDGVEMSVKGGLRIGFFAYDVPGFYLDLTVGMRAGVTSGSESAACAGVYGDLGFALDFLGVVEFKKEIPNIIALEGQVAPQPGDSCPLKNESEPKLPADNAAFDTNVDVDTPFETLVGTWVSADGKEKLVVRPDRTAHFSAAEVLLIGGYECDIRLSDYLTNQWMALEIVESPFLSNCGAMFAFHEFSGKPQTTAKYYPGDDAMGIHIARLHRAA
jgi:hypothetical protein